MQETFMNLQNKIHACKARELNLQHAMEIQNIEMKSLKKELDAMKNQMPEHERKMLKLMKANVEMKSTLEGKEDATMTKWTERCAPKRSTKDPNTRDSCHEF